MHESPQIANVDWGPSETSVDFWVGERGPDGRLAAVPAAAALPAFRALSRAELGAFLPRPVPPSLPTRPRPGLGSLER